MRDLNNYPVIIISRRMLKLARETVADDRYADAQLKKLKPDKPVHLYARQEYQAKQRRLTKVATAQGLSVERPYKIVTDAPDAWVILAVSHTGRVKQFVVNKE